METYSSINAYGYHSPSQYDPHSLHWCFHCPSTTKWVSTIPLPPHPFQQPFSSTPPPPPNPTFAPLAQIEMISNSINKIQDILTKMKERNSRMDSSFSQIRSLLHELQLESMALEDAKVEEATVEDAADNIVVCIDESALDLIDGNARAVDNSELETEHAETYSRNNVCKVFAEISNRKIAMEVGDSAKDDSGETVTQVFDKMFQSLSTPKYGLEVRAHKTPEYTHHTTLLGSPSKLFEIEFHVSIIDFPFDPGSFMLTTSSHNYFHVASSMNLRMQSSVKLFEMQSLQLSFHTKSPLFSHCSVICVVQHPAAKFYKPFATLPGIHALLISSRELWVPDSARLLATQFTRQVFHAILARERTGIMTTIGFVSPPRDTFSTHVNSATLGIFQFLWALNKTLADYVVTCSVARGSKNCVINHHFFCPVKIESSQKLSSDFLVHLTGILGNCQSSSINISALFPGLSPLLVSSMRQFQRLFMDTNIGDQLVHPKGFHAASHGFSLTSYFVDHKELGVLSVPATLDMLLLWHVCSEVARAQYLTSNDIQYSITSMVLGVGSINYNFKHGCDPVLTLFMEYIDNDASVLSLELAEQVLPINRHESYCYGLMKSYPLELGPYVDKQGATTQGFTFNSEVAWTQLGLCNIFRYDCPFRVAVQFVEKCSRTWSPLSSHLYTHSWQPITLYNLDETLMKLSFLFTNAFRWFSCTVAEEMAAPWVDIWAAMSRSLFAHLNSNLIRSDEQTLTAIARLSSPLRNSCSSPLFARNKFICGAFGFLAVNNNRVCAEGSYDATSRKCYIIHLMSLSLHTGMSPTIFYLHIEVLINIQCTLLNAQVGSGVSDKKYNWAQSLLKTKLPKCNLNEILGSMLTADEDNFLLWLQACSTRYTELTKDTFEHILFALVEVAADKSQKLTKKEELSSAIMTDFGLENTQHIEQAFSSFVCCSLNKLLVDVLAIMNNETHIFYFIKMSKRVHFMLCGRKLFQQRVETEGGGQVLTVISYESLLPGKETKLRFILEMQGQLLKEGNYGCNSGVMFFRFLFGLYFSFVALFAQLGGEIVLKAADVEIDLVGTVEAGIADDDSHSPFLDLNLEDKVLIEGGSIVVNGPIYMYNGLEKVFGLGAEMKRSQQIIWDPGGENITNGPKGI